MHAEHENCVASLEKAICACVMQGQTVDCMQLAGEKDEWRAFVNVVAQSPKDSASCAPTSRYRGRQP
jgi:hypothetical protein